MMDESELRRRFARLRESDQKGVPSFAQTYSRTRARQHARGSLRARTLVVGAAAAVLLAAVWLARTRSVSSEPASPISTWSAPTDVLLRIPGSELLGAMPALGTSVLDTMIPTPSKKGGA
jgi:hypothetical protein